MREALPDWADEVGDDEEPRRTTRPWILVLATVPWLVVLGLVFGGVVSGDSPAPSAQGAPGEARVQPAPTLTAPGMESESESEADGVPSGDPSASDGSSGGVSEHRPAPHPEHGGAGDDRATTTADGDPVGAIALAVARAWLTDIGPHLALEGIEPRDDLYLEHGVVEHIERHGDHAVVGVLAVVLVRDDERYTQVVARRLAVPVALGPPVRPAGAPWWLEEVDLTTAPPDHLVEEDDPGVLLALSEALATADLLDGEVLGASRTDDGWWLARTGDPDTPDEQVAVWLRPGSAGPVVAGPTGGSAPDEHVSEE